MWHSSLRFFSSFLLLFLLLFFTLTFSNPTSSSPESESEIWNLNQLGFDKIEIKSCTLFVSVKFSLADAATGHHVHLLDHDLPSSTHNKLIVRFSSLSLFHIKASLYFQFSLLADVICEQSTFHIFCLSFCPFLMVFQQAALNAVTPHICACEAYATLH